MKTKELIIALPTDSREKAFAFYKAAGFALARNPESDELPEPLEFRLTDSAVLMLVPRDGFTFISSGNAVAQPGTSETVLTFTVATRDEVHSLLAKVQSAGGAIVSEAADQPWGFAGQFKDLDGHLWMVTVAPSAA